MSAYITDQCMKFKVAVCGGGGVGKSALTIRYVQQQFVETWDPTIEDSYSKQLKINNKPVQMDILDTAGQEEYHALRDEYMRSSQGFLLVFDLGNRKTFLELSDFHTQILRSKDLRVPPLLLIGNKCDLEAGARQVTRREAKQLADKWNMQYFETSAKTGFSVDLVFETILNDVVALHNTLSARKKKLAMHNKKKCSIL